MDEPIIELDEELAEFVATVLTPIFEYRTGSIWCVEWWRHTEILNRVQDLCDGWNQIGAEEDGIDLNTWYRFYLDHHMPIIQNKESGPLKGCSTLSHRTPKTDQWAFPAPSDRSVDPATI